MIKRCNYAKSFSLQGVNGQDEKFDVSNFFYQDKRVIYWGKMVPFILVNKQ